MRTLTVLLLFVLPSWAGATNFTSTANGNWSVSTTWTPSGVPGSSDNVTIANTVTLDGNESVNNITINSGKTFTVSGSNSLTVYGNFTATGTFTCASGTVAFNGTLGQSIGGASTVTFNNLTINTTSAVNLTKNINVNGNLAISSGTLNCQTFQITGNTTGTMSISSGSYLLLGETASSTNVSFPYKFTSANISLDQFSGVTYEANTNQTVSDTPTYGSLILYTGSSPTTKTASGSPLNIAGILDINTNTTFSGSSGGTVNIGSNLANYGTYSPGTGTVNMDGSMPQSIGGTSITFYNLTISGTGTVDLGYNTTVSNTLSISSGTLDVTTNNYSVTVGGDFTNTGGTFNPHGNTVTMDGTSPTLGGSSTTNLNKLIIATSGTTTLGGDITLTDSLRINWGGEEKLYFLTLLFPRELSGNA